MPIPCACATVTADLPARFAQVVRSRRSCWPTVRRRRPCTALQQLREDEFPANAHLAGGRTLAREPPPCRRTQAASPRIRTQGAKRRVAGARDQGAALSLSARRHAAPGFHRTRPAGGRNGPGQNHPGHRRVRVAAPPGQGAARAGRHARFAQDRMGGADSALHRPAAISSSSARGTSGCRAYRRHGRRCGDPTSETSPRRSSPSSITSRCWPTRSR